MQTVFSQVFDEVRRVWPYRWMAAAIAAIIMTGATYYILGLPDKFESWGQIYFSEQPAVSNVAEGLGVRDNNAARVYLFGRTLLNDTNLDAVLEKVDLDFDRSTSEGAIKARNFIRASAGISMDGNAFVNIQYSDTDPVRARDVTRALVDQFIAANIAQARDDNERATEFLDEQIKSYEEKLRASEQEITAFRLDNIQVIGDTGYSTRVSNAIAAVNAAQAAYRAALTQSALTPPAASPRDTRIGAVEAELAVLRLRYTNGHPDVVNKERELNELRAGLGGSDPSPATPQADGNVILAQQTLIAAQNELNRLRRLEDVAPKVEAEYAELTRTNELIRGNYAELLGRLEATRLSKAIDSSEEVARYRVVAAPQLPLAPSGPNRPLMLLMAAGAALGGGLFASYLHALSRGIFVAPRELETTFGLPVIGTVSMEEAWYSKPRKSLRGRMLLLSLGAATAGGCLLLVLVGTGDVSIGALASGGFGELLGGLVR